MLPALLLVFAVAAQDAPSPVKVPGPAPKPAVKGLGPQDAAWIDDAQLITLAELDRYLATVYARKPEGQQALLQVLQEAIVEREAAQRNFVATDAEVDGALILLDKQTGGLDTALRADVDAAGLRNIVRLHVLQERLVRDALHLRPLDPVPADKLKAWMEQRVKDAALVEAPLDDARAASWAGGELAKQRVGTRLRALLEKEDVAGVLTEMIATQLVRRRADELGLQITPAAVTEEILQRNTALQTHAGGLQVNYAQYLEQVEHRSLQELIESDTFNTEVLARLITEQLWTESQARAWWERNKAAFETHGPKGDWEDVRYAVWKDIRFAVCNDLYAKSRILRRY